MTNRNWIKLKSFIKECYRVLLITKKPNSTEFKTIVKVTGMGILIVGLIGFIIAILGQLMGI
ncbi:MAG: protein translocase SEC61 complex subunit gamma [Nanoarchaeota archaeon]|nr:protein translocase SEC61 complex subunit gamma [Nanoarchaeota archaeon]